MKNDLLKLLDLSGEDIITILNTADQLKYETKHNIHKDYLKGKTLAMIFEKNSTRTRVSFETGMYQLGGHALFLSGPYFSSCCKNRGCSDSAIARSSGYVTLIQKRSPMTI